MLPEKKCQRLQSPQAAPGPCFVGRRCCLEPCGQEPRVAADWAQSWAATEQGAGVQVRLSGAAASLAGPYAPAAVGPSGRFEQVEEAVGEKQTSLHSRQAHTQHTVAYVFILPERREAMLCNVQVDLMLQVRTYRLRDRLRAHLRRGY